MPPAIPTVSIDRTMEVRWFFAGRLPAAVHSWFTDGNLGVREERCDNYRLDERNDIGVKQRSLQKLELKKRTEPPEIATIADGVRGQIETWQRWSPADQLLEPGSKSEWSAVDKRIIKRRFHPNGQERHLSADTRAMTGDGCDAEIVELSANEQDAWTFAFAAFGDPQTHRSSLAAAWQALIEQRTPPEQLRLNTDGSYGYPEWLTKTLLNGDSANS